jgi:hypothetical protein
VSSLWCNGCGRVLPDAAEDPLGRRLLEELGALSQGATTRELGRAVARRERTVFETLSQLEQDGLVERIASGRGRGWNARLWRLARKAPGVASAQPHGSGSAEGDPLPLLAFLASLSAAGDAEHPRAQVAFLTAAAFALLALALETTARAAGGRS